MRALIDPLSNKFYVSETVHYKDTAIPVGESGWCIRCRKVSGKRPNIGIHTHTCWDVSEYFQDPTNITLQEAEFFGMVYPNVKVFNVQTGEIYE